MSKQNTILESIAKILIINGDGNVLTFDFERTLKISREVISAGLAGWNRGCG